MKEIDSTRLEELAASGKKASAIWRELGVSDATFYTRLKADPELKAAYERGRIRAQEAKGGKGTNQKVPTSTTKLTAEERDVLEAVEAGGQNGATRASINRLDFIKYLDDAQLDATLRRLAGSGHINVKLEGINQVETFYLGRGNGAAAIPEEIKPVATKKSGKKAKAKKSGGKKGARKMRATQSLLSPGEIIPRENIGPAFVPTDGEGQLGHAISAAFTELAFVRFWGYPSPRFDDVFKLVDGARGLSQ